MNLTFCKFKLGFSNNVVVWQRYVLLPKQINSVTSSVMLIALFHKNYLLSILA